MYFYSTVYSDVVHKCQQQGAENRINSFPSQKQSCKHLSSQRHKRIVTFLRSFDIALHGGAIHEWWEKSLLKVNGAPSSVFRYIFAVPFCVSQVLLEKDAWFFKFWFRYHNGIPYISQCWQTLFFQHRI